MGYASNCGSKWTPAWDLPYATDAALKRKKKKKKTFLLYLLSYFFVPLYKIPQKSCLYSVAPVLLKLFVIRLFSQPLHQPVLIKVTSDLRVVMANSQSSNKFDRMITPSPLNYFLLCFQDASLSWLLLCQCFLNSPIPHCSPGLSAWLSFLFCRHLFLS